MPPSDRQSPLNPIASFGTRERSFRRRTTDGSARRPTWPQRFGRAESYQSQAEKEGEARKTERYQEFYSVYAGLEWTVVRDYLQRKFPTEVFKEEIRDDKWVFDVPMPLTDEDKKCLDKLRDKSAKGQDGQRGQRDSISPEP
ncbi:hypothetical protein F4776DRAFT_199321 [Hypoxylon sp. NC0597]|nr:hypothetical protein F4776DRAFT_199321 [Hypoxylon sp. NC0597]